MGVLHPLPLTIISLHLSRGLFQPLPLHVAPLRLTLQVLRGQPPQQALTSTAAGPSRVAGLIRAALRM